MKSQEEVQQELQRKMQQLTKPYQDRFKTEQQAFFAGTPYKEDTPLKLSIYRQFCLMHLSEAALNVSLDYWKYLYAGKIEVYKLADIITILQAAQRRTYREWLNAVPYKQEEQATALLDWVGFREDVAAMENVVNPLVETFTMELLDKLLRTQHLDISGQSRSIPMPHKK